MQVYNNEEKDLKCVQIFWRDIVVASVVMH